MQNTPSAKTDALAFERWINEAGPSWSPALCDKARYALLALKILDQPNVPEPMVKESAKDMAAFLEAYAAHIASKGAPK